ncbi:MULTISPECIES: hypothetical protein [Pectobacterium]|uniref:hypothetical protein n=1 Tax=Pectobacterium TaxID=122277 RepID=UPI0013C3FCDD|nr:MULTISPECIES: hypothetical protein [Pectobacterium]MCA6960993.1 hypothetical protein [Pectobacterium odoriferum]MCH5009104.1 hypothetical protein [Pectobacterium odoriferum]
MNENNIFEEIAKLSFDNIDCTSLRVLRRLFIERASIITDKLLPCIEKSIQNEKFKNKVISEFNKIHNQEISFKCLSKMIKHDIKTTNVIGMLNNSYKLTHGNDGSLYLAKNYELFFISSILFDSYIHNIKTYNIITRKSSKRLQEIYKEIDINLNNYDTQFLKYNLLSLNENIIIINNTANHALKDHRLRYYLHISIPTRILSSIEELIKSDLISDISFRIDDITDSIYMTKAIETGSPLKLNISHLPSISKFYSNENYHDTFWVHHDPNKRSITFEELRDDFNISDDQVVTQIIHLEYIADDEIFFIKHLDHEYILYTLEQYEEKIKNPKTRGSEKIKSFKIDNSRIPFTQKINNEYFLYQVLDEYFVNNDLVSEYFQNCK